MRVNRTLERTNRLLRKLGIPVEPWGFPNRSVRQTGVTVPTSETEAVNALFGVRPLDLDLSAEPERIANALLLETKGLPPGLDVSSLSALPEPERIRILRRGRWRGQPLSQASWGEAVLAFANAEIQTALEGVQGFEFLVTSDLSAFVYLLFLTSWATVGFDNDERPVGGFSRIYKALRERAEAAGVRFLQGARVRRVCKVRTKCAPPQWRVCFEKGGNLGCVTAPACVLAVAPASIQEILPSLPKDMPPLVTVPTTKAAVTVEESAEEAVLPSALVCRDFVVRDAQSRQAFRWCSSSSANGRTRRTAWLTYFTDQAGVSTGGLDEQGWLDQLRALGLVQADARVVSVKALPVFMQFWSRWSPSLPNAGRCGPDLSPAQDPGTAMRRWSLGLDPCAKNGETGLFGAHSFMSTSWQAWLEGSLQLTEVISPHLFRTWRELSFDPSFRRGRTHNQ